MRPALANADMRSFTLPALLGAKVGERQVPERYQGNHANLAGWLPPRAAPVSPLAAICRGGSKPPRPRASGLR